MRAPLCSATALPRAYDAGVNDDALAPAMDELRDELRPELSRLLDALHPDDLGSLDTAWEAILSEVLSEG